MKLRFHIYYLSYFIVFVYITHFSDLVYLFLVHLVHVLTHFPRQTSIPETVDTSFGTLTRHIEVHRLIIHRLVRCSSEKELGVFKLHLEAVSSTSKPAFLGHSKEYYNLFNTDFSSHLLGVRRNLIPSLIPSQFLTLVNYVSLDLRFGNTMERQMDKQTGVAQACKYERDVFWFTHFAEGSKSASSSTSQICSSIFRLDAWIQQEPNRTIKNINNGMIISIQCVICERGFVGYNPFTNAFGKFSYFHFANCAYSWSESLMTGLSKIIANVRVFGADDPALETTT
ncbi:hypothetical protein Sjap_013185 [Stephania japonica]|uniref:Uncharacterized protein n=1 Tax=Stephania japonica TaxID=461633 RepID=A0AAP0IXM8_9MAGN